MNVDSWDANKVKKILKIIWNILFIYLICVMVYVWFDAQNNPQYYALVSERPVKDTSTNSNILIGSQDQFIPDWQYEASTMEECKPLVHIMGIYDIAIKPFVWVLLIVILIQAINTFALEQQKDKDKTNKVDDDDETK